MPFVTESLCSQQFLCVKPAAHYSNTVHKPRHFRMSKRYVCVQAAAIALPLGAGIGMSVGMQKQVKGWCVDTTPDPERPLKLSKRHTCH